MPACDRLVSYVQATGLSGFRRVYPGGAPTGELPPGHPPIRLPSGISRRSPNWCATARPSTYQASVGYIPAEPQLVRYLQTIHRSGFRRVYPGGATTGQLPPGHDTPSVESPTCHHTGTPSRPNQAAAYFGLGGAPFCLWAPALASTLCISAPVAGQFSLRRDDPDDPDEASGTSGTEMGRAWMPTRASSHRATRRLSSWKLQGRPALMPVPAPARRQLFSNRHGLTLRLRDSGWEMVIRDHCAKSSPWQQSNKSIGIRIHRSRAGRSRLADVGVAGD